MELLSQRPLRDSVMLPRPLREGVFRLALPTGAYYTWNGTVLEGTPIEPDEQVVFDWQQSRAGIDVQLERAIDGLRTESARLVN
jgi:hypothetical protein